MKFHISILLGSLFFVAAVLPAFATDSSSAWNHNGQVRTHSCTPMKDFTIPLRFPDGTGTGFYANAFDPSKNGSAPDCGAGYVEIDAQEILYTGGGMDLYF